ncbi:type 2 periplasmic-binding domain-containing protein [Cohnella fermenti]|uniref:Extracellular solute-binding protein n=1 Tax=Cohnella fermenti TaxID=2565925 RepID=A0A4S4BH17_9BACL|nr:extracellular solute-binding protein [Cohnella fermenti]THF73186.1 extracellular solute-binding protein [Cohnella fermenti]
MKVKRLTAGILASTMFVVLAACSGNNGNTSSPSPSPSASPSESASASVSPSESASASPDDSGLDHSKELTLTVFSTTANYAGEQTGWFAKLIKDKFNIKMNIIASNLDGGDAKIAAMMASGDMGDIIVWGDDKGNYPNAIKAGLVRDLTKDDLLNKYGKDLVARYPKAIEKAKISFGDGNAVYGIGNNVATNPTGPSEGTEMTWGPDLRWDLYQQIGAPEINSVEDYLPVLKKMQELEPTNDQGKKTYAFSLWSDWDGGYKMTLAKQFANMFGYDEIVDTALYVKADEPKYYDFLSDESWYMKSLKLYFDANQLGLVDPDSPTQKFDDVAGKYKDGRLLFSWFPWLGAANYNTPERTAEGKGFALVPFKGELMYSTGFNVYGGNGIISIGSKAKEPERIMEFINWMYTPEGAMISAGSGTAVPNGPKGLLWDINSDGKVYVTDLGWQAYQDQKGTSIPDEYGGGNFADGMNQINFSFVIPADVNPETGEAYDHNLWETSLTRNPSKLVSDWREKMGVLTAKEYFVKNDALAVAPQGFTGKEPLQMDQSLLQKNKQIGTIIQQYSWKMVFAKNETEYNKLKDEMIKKVTGLGYYDEIMDFSIQKAEELFEARKSVTQ